MTNPKQIHSCLAFFEPASKDSAFSFLSFFCSRCRVFVLVCLNGGLPLGQGKPPVLMQMLISLESATLTQKTEGIYGTTGFQMQIQEIQ